MWTAEEYLAHSAKGTSWSKKDHKYVKKVGDKYYYKEDIPIRDTMGRAQYQAHINDYNSRVSFNKANADSKMAEGLSNYHSKIPAFEKEYRDSENKYRDSADKGYKDAENYAKIANFNANLYNRKASQLKYNEDNRKFVAKVDMAFAEIGDAIRSVGEAFLKKLGIK